MKTSPNSALPLSAGGSNSPVVHMRSSGANWQGAGSSLLTERCRISADRPECQNLLCVEKVCAMERAVRAVSIEQGCQVSQRDTACDLVPQHHPSHIGLDSEICARLLMDLFLCRRLSCQAAHQRLFFVPL